MWRLILMEAADVDGAAWCRTGWGDPPPQCLWRKGSDLGSNFGRALAMARFPILLKSCHGVLFRKNGANDIVFYILLCLFTAASFAIL
jgi:hypothetical protein